MTSKPDDDIVIKLAADRAALIALAEALGEIAADLWLDGKLDLDDELVLTVHAPREIVEP